MIPTRDPLRLLIRSRNPTSIEDRDAALQLVQNGKAGIEDDGGLPGQFGWEIRDVIFEEVDDPFERVQFARDGVEIGAGLADLADEAGDGGRGLCDGVADAEAGRINVSKPKDKK